MKCTARNIRILTSEEMLTILRKSATLYLERASRIPMTIMKSGLVRIISCIWQG